MPGVGHPWFWVAVLAVAACNISINRLAPRGLYVPAGLALSGLLLLIGWGAGLSAGDLGIEQSTLVRATLVGLAVAAALAGGYVVATLIPAAAAALVNEQARSMSGRELGYETLWRIPLGTVLLEEIAFRGLLPGLLGAAPGVAWSWSAVLVSSALFGFWHVIPALSMSQQYAAVSAIGTRRWLTVLGTVVVTAIAGVGFSALAWLGHGLLTSVIAHWALNGLGLAAAWRVIHR